MDTCIRGDQMAHYAKCGGQDKPHKSGKRSYPAVKKSFKIQHGRIPIDPAILAAIGHRLT